MPKVPGAAKEEDMMAEADMAPMEM